MLFSCATALLDNQKRKSTGIQWFVFGGYFYFDEGTASHSLFLQICKYKTFFPNSPDPASKLWRYDWCKNTCWCVVVGSNTGDCATRWWNHIGWQMSLCVALSWSFLWACSTKVAPVMGEISSLHSCIDVCFVPVETAAPTLNSDGAQKNFGFLLLCASCIWNSNELVCSKMEKRPFEIEWNVTSAESCSHRNLKMRPDQKITADIYDSKHAWFFLTYINDIYSCSFKKYYTPIWFGS